MEPINLEPRYSTRELPGRCLKCLAEEELFGCLYTLLRDEDDNPVAASRYEALLTFLQSSESMALRDEAERHLSDGKKVSVVINYTGKKPEYKLKIE